MMAEEIIQKAEKLKLKRLKKDGNAREVMLKRQHMSLTLSDVIEGY
jgi:thiamine biosynthesis lipoprotein ApbE